MLQGDVALMGTLSAVRVIAIAEFIIRNGAVVRRRTALAQVLCAGLIIGGGASNVRDRLLHGAVIDFTDIRGITGWNWVFNTGDAAVHLGVRPLVLLTLRSAKPPPPEPLRGPTGAPRGT